MTAPLDDLAMRLQTAVVGTLSLEAELGRGGMGTVYLARDVALDRPVAVKLLDPALASDPEVRARFVAEARTGARLVHPNIVPIYDVGEADDLVWFVMAYVDGESLVARLHRTGPLPPDEIRRILTDIGWALAAAHAAGVLHRDVTLTNVMLERQTGRAMLADFGLALPHEAGDGAPLVGTPEYLAPELLHHAPPSPASDLYALGVVGWALCTGRLPYVGATPGEILLQRLQHEPAPLAEAAPGTPRALRHGIEAALASDPTRRPSSVEAWLTSLAPETAAVQLATPLSRWLTLGERAQPFYALALLMTGLGFVHSSAFFPSGGGLVQLVVVVFGLTSLAAVGHGLASLRTHERLVRDGFTVADLRLALAKARDERVARGTVRASTLGRVVNDLAWLSALSVVCLSYLFSSFGWREAPLWLNSLYFLVGDHIDTLIQAFFFGLAFNRLVPATDRAPDTIGDKLRRWVWRSPIGSGWLRLLSAGRTAAPTTATLHRPTEVMLGLGIADLHAALPAPQRAALREVPTVAQRLQDRVAAVRERLALLDGAAGRGGAEVAALRERLLAARDEAIGALERLRRELLRLGAEARITGPLTERLQAVQEADAMVVAVLRSEG